MKNRKPSELPINTLIKFENDEYIKQFFDWTGNQWVTLGCIDCQGGDDFTDDEADKKFTNFEILAIDPTFESDDVDLHGEWDRDSHTFADGTPAHHCKRFNCVA